MNILFIVLPYLSQSQHSTTSSKVRTFKNIPYGVMSISKYIKEKLEDTHTIEILDLNVNTNSTLDEQILKRISTTKPDVVGFSIMFDTSYSYINKFSAIVKDYNDDIITLIGGASATMSYKEILLNNLSIDAVLHGEGEEPFIRFLQSENKIDFLEEDISFVTKKSLQKNKIPIPSKLENLDSVVDIDYSMIDFNNYTMEEAFSPYCSTEQTKQFFLITSRGCPFKCTFCMHSAHDDKSVRYASVETLTKHIAFMIKEYDVNTLTIYDDQILFNKKRAKTFFKALKKFNLRVELPNGITAMFIDEELARDMRMAGVDTVQLAIESGSEYVVKTLMKKPVVLSKVKDVVGYLRKYDFWIQAFFVNGMPGEMKEHREETISFIKEVGFDWSSFSLAFPSMGSKLYEECIDNAYIDHDTSILTLDSTNQYVIRNPDYSREHIIDKTYLMNLETNFVHNYRLKNGDYITAEKAFRDVLKRYSKQAFALYFLAKALEMQNKKTEAKECYDKMKIVINEDSNWEKYFKYFNIDYKKVLHD